MGIAAELCDRYASEGLIANPRRMAFYLETVFAGLEFEGATVLDVGSGIGLASCYAALHGAARVVALEPEGDGTISDARHKAARMFDLLGIAPRIEVLTESIQQFEARDGAFDVVLLHDSINHLQEDACAELGRSEAARSAYRTLFTKIARLMRPGAPLFVSDCSPRNLFHALRLPNPFTQHNIAWTKHQPPSRWIALLEETGFASADLSWSPVNRFYEPGRALTGNRLVAYFGTSHFYFTMRRQSAAHR